jgi:cryptochrome
VFDLHLLDADWAINNGNWMWLSCSCFFYQYFRCYSPVAFGKKYDPDGDMVRRYIPALKSMPKKYIFEPWTAPPGVQKAANCIIGKDYPSPIVEHKTIVKANMGRMKQAYDAHKAAAGGGAAGGGTSKAKGKRAQAGTSAGGGPKKRQKTLLEL